MMDENETVNPTKVSVIVPVYNTERYLRRCLESIINQTIQEIEIICVDDGSTDGSHGILEEYAARDSRIRVIQKENGGLVSARKLGVKEASGQFIGYVDSDDWIEPMMYLRLYDLAIEAGVELVTSGYYREGGYTTLHCDTLPEGTYKDDGIVYLRNHTIYNLSQKETGLRGSLCCKLFLAERLKEIQRRVPDSITYAEDKICLLMYVLECSSVYVSKEAYYHYMINPSSMVQTPSRDYLCKVNDVYQCLINLYQHKNFTPIMRREAEIYIAELLIMGINSRLGFGMENLLWIDSYWVDRFPSNSKIILYGAGELGKIYRRQLSCRKDLKYIGCIDFGFSKHQGEQPKEGREDDSLIVRNPAEVRNMTYDYIVITIKNPQKAEQVKGQLAELNVDAEKILWFEQREIFWRYAEGNGLLLE